MNENVQVINKNGDGMVAEGIAYIQLTETNKKYLFYTLNEKVDNDLTKIYIAEVSEQVGGANSINDAEWDDLRKKMVKISHKEELPEINYLNMNDQSFNVGEPKKLAVTTVAKQAFKDAQITHTVSTNQTDTPVVTGTSTFFSQEETPSENQVEQNNESIFANPPQPVENAVVEETPAPVQQEVVEEPAVEPIQPQVNEVAPEQVETQNTEVINETPEVQAIEPVAPVVGEPMIEQTTAPATPVLQPEAVIPETPVVPEVTEIPVDSIAPVEAVAPVMETPIIDTPEVSADTDTTNSGTAKTIISDEEALKAINVIQEYIDQEEAGQ